MQSKALITIQYDSMVTGTTPGPERGSAGAVEDLAGGYSPVIVTSMAHVMPMKMRPQDDLEVFLQVVQLCRRSIGLARLTDGYLPITTPVRGGPDRSPAAHHQQHARVLKPEWAIMQQVDHTPEQHHK